MKNTPAFPIAHQIIDANDTHFKLGNSGMSLRDYFAAKAMQSFLAGLNEDDFCADGIAIMAYQMADSMLKERAR